MLYTNIPNTTNSHDLRLIIHIILDADLAGTFIQSLGWFDKNQIVCISFFLLLSVENQAFKLTKNSFTKNLFWLFNRTKKPKAKSQLPNTPLGPLVFHSK